jgi:hypothetical protein
MLVGGTAAVYGTVATLIYIDRNIAFVTGAKTSLVGHPQTEVRVPFPTLNEEVEVKH